MSENLDKIKAVFTSNIDSAFGPESVVAPRSTIDAMVEALSEDEKKEFILFMDEYVAKQYDKAMEEFSPELKAMTDLFISDCVAEETGGTPSTGDQKEAAVKAVPEKERHLLRSVVSSNVVNCVINVRVREKQAIAA